MSLPTSVLQTLLFVFCLAQAYRLVQLHGAGSFWARKFLAPWAALLGLAVAAPFAASSTIPLVAALGSLGRERLTLHLALAAVFGEGLIRCLPQLDGAAAEQLLKRSVALEASGSFGSAESRARFAEALFRTGRLLERHGRFSLAFELQQRVIALCPSHYPVHVNLAAMLGKKGRPGEAEHLCRQAIALRPKYPYAHFLLGLGLKDQNRRAEAAASFREAVRLGLPDKYRQLALSEIQSLEA